MSNATITGSRSALAEARRAVCDLCDRMGLENGAVLSRPYVQNSVDETRRELAAVVHAAGVVHKVAEAFHMRLPRSAGIAEIASCALVLEAEAAKAIHLCDTVIRERADLAALAKTEPAVLDNRRMQLHRGAGDDR